MRRCVAVWGMLMIAMPAGMAVAQTATQNDVDGGNSPAEQAVPQPIADPRSVFKADDYPVEALRNNEEGRITTSLDVDASGRPTRCNVITSSGSAAIDATTCSIFLQRARFKPAIRAGKAVAGTSAPVSINWAIPKGGLELQQGQSLSTVDHEIEYALNTRGEVMSCRVIRNAAPAIDPCKAAPMGTVMLTPPPQRDGQPVNSRMRTTVKVVITAD